MADFEEKEKALKSLSPTISRLYKSEAEGTRTLNLRIDSPMEQNDKSCHSKGLQQAGKGAYKPAYKNILEIAENKTQIDIRKLPTELADIVAVWHKLPEHIKTAIKALAQIKIEPTQGG